jgi:hypothetical protein
MVIPRATGPRAQLYFALLSSAICNVDVTDDKNALINRRLHSREREVTMRSGPSTTALAAQREYRVCKSGCRAPDTGTS